MCVNYISPKGLKVSGITIIPKDKTARRKKGKAGLLVWNTSHIHEVKIYAEDSFWDAWEQSHFDLSLIRVFYTQVPQATKDEVITICDGKSVIIGKRVGKTKAILTGGYSLKHIYSEAWVKKKGFVYSPHYQVRIGIDHKRHFIKRYKERIFDLGLVAAFIGKVAQARLGQKVKIISENDILVGVRTTANHAMLITGMVRGEMDWDDYVDVKFEKNV